MDKTLAKGLKVLEHVARSREALGASDVAAALDMTKSNAYRTLQTLVALKYIVRQPGQPVYLPTTRLFELGTIVGNRFGVKLHALPILQEVAHRTGETAAVAVREDRDVVYLERFESPNPVRSVIKPGERLPAYCAASGKVLLAYAPDELIDGMAGALAPFTEHTITTLDGLRAGFAEVRREGVAIAIREWHMQVAGIAVPIRNSSGEVVAALSISGPASRFSTERIAGYTEAARWGAEEFLHFI